VKLVETKKGNNFDHRKANRWYNVETHRCVCVQLNYTYYK
jgi:hypothetical protein